MNPQHDTGLVGARAPHAFVERLNLPYQIPKSINVDNGSLFEIPFRKASVPDDCELCGKRLSDPIHAASEEAAAGENWPV